MSNVRLNLGREETAKVEVGHTDVSRATAFCLVMTFLLLIFAVPIVQQVHDVRSYFSGERATPIPQCYDVLEAFPKAFRALKDSGRSLVRRVFQANSILMREFRQYEDTLDNESVVGRMFRKPVQYVLVRWLGVGNEKAYRGIGPWLFYRPGIDYLTQPGFLEPAQLAKRSASGTEWKAAPQPDPRVAILHFRDQLAERGVALAVYVTPVKPVIQPGRFSAAYTDCDVPLQNPSYDEFRDELVREGVIVLDPSDPLIRLRTDNGIPQYLATDTHWTPSAMGVCAELLAITVQSTFSLDPAPDPGLSRVSRTIEGEGDILTMLQLPKDQSLFSRESVEIQQVLDARESTWRADARADILVLGDSFSNIYSIEAMGWGESAGFVEQLSYWLKRPLDRIVINDHGAYATRASLARDLARGRDRLAGKKLVVWQFAMRELSEGDWQIIDLVDGDPVVSEFLVPKQGEEIPVHAVVAEASFVPRPGTVPYKDHVLAVHLVDVSGESISDGQAMVYLMSMADNEWTAAARLRPGDTVDLTLKSWSDVSAQYEGLNRSELDDMDLQLQEPCWGEL